MAQLSLFDDRGPTLGQYVQRWLAQWNRPPWVTARTAEVRAQLVEYYVLPTFGSVALAAITTPMVSRWHQGLFDAGYRHNTVKLIVGGFSAVLGQARRDGLIATNPARGLRWPRYDEPRPDPYTASEIRRIVGWFRKHEPQWLALVALVCLAGLRPSEACGLDWRDVDLDARQVTIGRAVVNRVPGPTKTRRSRRVIRVTAEVARYLTGVEHRDGLVVRDRRGGPVSSGRWGTYYWRRALAALGIRHRGFYRGRSAFLSDRVAHGAPLFELADYAGTSVQRLEQNYVRWMGPLEVPGRLRRGHGCGD